MLKISTTSNVQCTNVYVHIMNNVQTCMYIALPLVLDMRCYPSFPTARFRGPCAECYGPFQNSTWPSPQSYQGGVSSGGREDQQLSAAILAALTLVCLTGETQYSIPCTERVPLQSRYWGQQREAICTGMNWTLRYR